MKQSLTSGSYIVNKFEETQITKVISPAKYLDADVTRNGVMTKSLPWY